MAADSLTKTIAKLKGTKSVLSPTTMQHLIKGPMGLTAFPLIHINDPEKLPADSARIFSHPLYRMFFGENGQSMLLQVQHNHFTTPEAAAQYLEQVNALLQTTDLRYRLIGKLTAQNEFITYIQKDFSLFLIAALAISFCLLLWIFRSLKSALLPYLISLTTLLWLLGLMAGLGFSLTILGSLIPPIILFVSSSDAIHLLHSYRKAPAQGHIGKLQQGAQKVFIPTFLTSITTATGFFSLFTINTVPVQELGLFAGIGVLLAFVVTFLFGPLIISGDQKKQQTHSPKMTFLALLTLRHQRAISVGAFVCIAVAAWGISELKTDAYLLGDLPAESPTRIDFDYVDQTFGGSKPWELAIWPADSTQTLWEQSVAAELAKIATYLHEIYGMEQLWSPVSLLKYGHQINLGGLPHHFRLPETKTDHRQAVQNARRLLNKKQSPALITADGSYGRFAGFIPEYGSRETIQRNNELLQYLQRQVDTSVLRYQLTGTTHLIDKSHQLLATHLLQGLAIGIGIIGLILGMYFRSVKIALLSLLPNALPLIIVAGYMGITGITLQLTTSIIFAIAFGIAVDDTIHFVAVYQRAPVKHPVWRLVYTYKTAGTALILTTLVVVTGFSLFITSSFGATHFLGLFLSISLLVALLTDLTLLPLLLHYFCKNNQR
ncbi:efflux RND transporter permease subunit [Marinoscillum furvescens]|uniref:SSD domain-containing protein n=1 Tax=Marinoscillum furvescens DSM 4134 TaxID=1122208 RepID=A0A3D9L1G6_MARFU|nr:MMPL family transporter [Marinoscillum furvescens]RED95577.1 hypothetical protein C7460_11726 [Marinoscillum furvescens DSM 4134]